LVVFDVRAEAMEPLVASGASAAASPAVVGSICGVVCVMVRDDDQVWDVVAGEGRDGSGGVLSTASPGTVVAVHSTISAETAEALEALARSKDVHVVDAPVSGGFMGAHDGTLAILAGGDALAVEKCRAPFDLFAGLVVHLGPIGAGTKGKLARNLLHFAAFTAAFEAATLAEAAGIDLRLLAQVVKHSDAITGGPGAILVRGETGPLADTDPLRPIFEHTRDLGEKDLRLALELGAELEVDLPMGRLALERLAEGLGVGPAAGSEEGDG
jgi:3-hydroxyisobutyrate dehydrogenase-like beta-hydroxyacid dehydrogenase